MKTLNIDSARTVALKLLVGATGFIAVASMIPSSLGAVGTSGTSTGSSMTSNSAGDSAGSTGSTLESSSNVQSTNPSISNRSNIGANTGVPAPGATTIGGNLGYSGTGSGALSGSSSTPGTGGIPRADTGTGFGTSTGIGANTGTSLNDSDRFQFSSSQPGLNYNSPSMPDKGRDYGVGNFVFDAPSDVQTPADITPPAGKRSTETQLQVDQ